jgi:hypothetical protein
MLAHDRQDGRDVALDQVGRHPGEVRRMLDQSAKALGRGRCHRIAECRGMSLDVMSGAKQLVAGFRGHAVAHQLRMRRGQAVALHRHPTLEFAGQFGERPLGARDGIVMLACVERAQRVAQRVRLGDDLMLGIGLDLEVGRLGLPGPGHDESPPLSDQLVTRALSSSAGCWMISALPLPRRSGPI